MIATPGSEGPAKSPQVVALTGFMGAGKSTVGRALASSLRWTFLDLDEEIERLQQSRIRDLFRIFGEARFREIESLILNNTLANLPENTVIALGGGTFIQPNNVDSLASVGARVVFLHAPVEELFQRCSKMASAGENLRPLLTSPDAFFALYEQRLPHYRTAHLRVETAGKSAKEIAHEIVMALSRVRFPV